MKDWLYGGVFLNKNTQEILKAKFSKHIPEGWTIYCHHMTCLFHTTNNQEIFNYLIKNEGQEKLLKIVSIGVSDRAIAFGVETDVPSNNENKHITLAVAPGAKPVESNYIIDWYKIDKPIEINGVVNFFKK